MPEIINFWGFNLICSMICSVLYLQFFKLAVKGSKDNGAAIIVLYLIATASILLLTPLYALKFPSDPKWYLFLLAACAFYAFTDRVNTTVRQHLPVSTYSILNRLSTVFIIFYGVVIFHNQLTLLKVLGAGLIIAGNAMIFYRAGKFEFNRYSLLAVLSSFTFATALSIDVDISSQFNLPIYIAFTLFIPAVLVFLAERKPVMAIVNEFRLGARRYLIATGICWAGLIFFMLRAYVGGDMTVISPLSTTTVLISVIAAYFIHKEKEHLVLKIAAAIVIIIGIYLTVASTGA
jgi:drug/metabolite transporter (DMT)-like permease